jgi:hypothetical protein
VIQDIGTRYGFDVGARVGADWRPFQSLSFSVEGGAHGQIYDDSRATIPYAMARLNLLLDPAELSSPAAIRTRPSTYMPTQPRTLPMNAPR